MNAGMFDPRYVDSVALDSRIPNQMNKPTQRRLMCRWGARRTGDRPALGGTTAPMTRAIRTRCANLRGDLK